MHKLVPMRVYIRPEILMSDDPEIICLLKKNQADVLRRLVSVYLKQRSTYIVGDVVNSCAEYVDDKTLQDLICVAEDIEFRLLGDEITMDALNDIADALSMLAKCVCEMKTVDATKIDVADRMIKNGLTPVVDIESADYQSFFYNMPACSAANIYYDAAYTIIKNIIEKVEYAQNFVTLADMVLAVIAYLSGGLAVPIVVATLLVMMFYDYAQKSFFDRLMSDVVTYKRDVVCALYKDMQNQNLPQMTETASAIENLPASLGETLKFLMLGNFGNYLIKRVIERNKVEQLDVVNCLYCDVPYGDIMLSGVYGSSDFYGANDNGYYYSSWPTWLESRAFNVQNGNYIIKWLPRYGAQRVRIYTHGYLATELVGESVNGLLQVQFQYPTCVSFLRFSPSASVKYCTIAKVS